MSDMQTARSLAGAGQNQSVIRAFAALEAVASGQGAGVPTSEIVLATGLPRSTALRTLATLLELGVVDRQGDGSWVIGARMLELSLPTSPLLRVRDECRRILLALSEEVGETSMLAIPYGDHAARIVAEVEGNQLLGVRSRWEGRVVAHSASGFVRTVLAEQPEDRIRLYLESMDHPRRTPDTKTDIEELVEAILLIRKQGHSAVVNELESGIAGVGMSIRYEGQLVGMLAVYLPTIRLTAGLHAHILESLQSAAAEMSAAIAA